MDSENFWYFFLKIRERLTLIIDNNVRNHIPLEEIDEEVLKEMYGWYLRSDLFQTETNTDKETYTQTTIADIKAVIPSPNSVA